VAAGFQNCATGLELGFQAARSYFADETAEHGPALDPLPGEVGDGVVWPGRAELTAAMRSSSVVMGLVLS